MRTSARKAGPARALKIPGRSYEIAHDRSNDNRGVDVAFIYDGGLFEAREQFSHDIMKRHATRDLFQVNFRLKGRGGGKARELIAERNDQ